MGPGARRVGAALVALSLIAPSAAWAAGSVDVAALQVALRARSLYAGTIDGYAGAATRAAVMRFQRRARLAVDGIAGPLTRRALGRLGRHRLGSRTIGPGAVGWDVSALQFRLAWRGFPSGNFDGGYGPHLQAAITGYQRWAGLPQVGIAGPATLASLRSHPIPVSPLRMRRPVPAAIGDGFGPRGDSFHPGLDFLSRAGAGVFAAATGRVEFAGYNDGYGRLVVLRHGQGTTSWYAHLSRITVRRGETVSAGERLGLVGATGEATGPHLHFEVRLRGAALDPRTAIG
jgi:peptidoglycan hydrolase-like protein with peptidoglycan-binding domain